MKKYAITVAIVGLLAFAGGAAASRRWLITSTNQIKPSVLHALRGNAGRQGPAGGFSTANVTDVSGPSVTMDVSGGANDVQGSLAQCPTGSVVLGGGYDGETNPPVSATVGYDESLGGNAWDVIMSNNDGYGTASFHAVAVCATGAGAAARARSMNRSQLAAIVAQQIAVLRRQRH